MIPTRKKGDKIKYFWVPTSELGNVLQCNISTSVSGSYTLCETLYYLDEGKNIVTYSHDENRNVIQTDINYELLEPDDVLKDLNKLVDELEE